MEVLRRFQGDIGKLYVPFSGARRRKFGNVTLDLVGTYLYEQTAKDIVKQINQDNDYSMRVVKIKGGYALYMRLKKRSGGV